MEIRDKVVMVTGGLSGLGLATSKALVGEGARVILLDLPNNDFAAVEAELGDSALYVPTDVTQPAQVEHALEEAAKQGLVAGVVNCAGIVRGAKTTGSKGPFPLDVFQHVIDINLTGTFNVVRLAAHHMAQQPTDDEERGVIVMTSSVAAFEGQIGQAAYSASKAGISGMTLPIARELASHKIRVVSIAPGVFMTPMFDSLPPDTVDSLGKQVPHPNRLGKPEEYAALVSHIFANPMINGDTIRLDGAIRMSAQ